jgi:hypothetical protein
MDYDKKRVAELEERVAKYRRRIIALKKEADPDACDCSRDAEDEGRCLICGDSFCLNCYDHTVCSCSDVICGNCADEPTQKRCADCDDANCPACFTAACCVCEAKLCKSCAADASCVKCKLPVCEEHSEEHEFIHKRDKLLVYMGLPNACPDAVLLAISASLKR